MLVVFLRREIGEFDIGPVIQARSLRALAGRQARPSLRRKSLRDLLGRAGDFGLVDPGLELIGGMRAQHIALAGPAQLHLDPAHTIDRCRWPPSRTARRRPERARSSRAAISGFVTKRMLLGHLSGGAALRLVGPVLWQIELAIDEGAALVRHISGKHADLAVGDLAR